MFLEVIVQSGEADTLCAPEPRSTDSLGTQHHANFESHSNRVTFETNAIRMTSSIQALGGEKNKQKIGTFLETLGED